MEEKGLEGDLRLSTPAVLQGDDGIREEDWIELYIRPSQVEEPWGEGVCGVLVSDVHVDSSLLHTHKQPHLVQ